MSKKTAQKSHLAACWLGLTFFLPQLYFFGLFSLAQLRVEVRRDLQLGTWSGGGREGVRNFLTVGGKRRFHSPSLSLPPFRSTLA